MTIISPQRHAALILVFHPGHEFVIDNTKGLRNLDRVPRRSGTRVSIQSGPPDGEPCGVHLDLLWSHSAVVMSDLVTSRSALAYCALQIVQYVGLEDQIGPGIPIGAEWVEALALLGGCLDIDQYVVEVSTDA